MLSKFDSSQYFRLLTSGKLHRQDKGWIGFEQREPGAIPALLDAFSYMLDHLELPEGLSVSYLLQLHKIIQSGVRNKKNKSTPGEVRYLIVARPLFASSTSLEHLEELFTIRLGDETTVFRSKKFNPNNDLTNPSGVMEFLKANNEVLYQHWYPNLSDEEQGALEQEFGLARFYEVKAQVQMQFINRASQSIDAFNDMMLHELNDGERLYHIAKLIRELSFLHLFQDGNTRLLCGILLNQLLIKYGFLPACLFNQNAVSDVCFADWVAEIKRGMQTTQALLQDFSASLYGFSIEELSTKHTRYMANLVLPIAAKIKFMTAYPASFVSQLLNLIRSMNPDTLLSNIMQLENQQRQNDCQAASVVTESQHSCGIEPSYEQFCGALVFNFFNQLSQSLNYDFGLTCVDEWITNTQHAHLVLSFEACCAWCYRIDSKPPKAKNNFGSFYDFGSHEFLLHIALGTFHWNVGLVRFNRTTNQPYRLVRREESAYRDVMKQVAQMALGKTLDYRYWGLGWVSMDMGRLDDFKKSSVIELLLNPSHSVAYQNILTPLMIELRSLVPKRV